MKPVYFQDPPVSVEEVITWSVIALVLGCAAYWRTGSLLWPALALAFAGLRPFLRAWGHLREKRLVEQARMREPVRGLLSDDVHGSEVVWRIDRPPEPPLYLDWRTRQGLRRGQQEPTHVSWRIGSAQPHGTNLAQSHPILLWPLDRNQFLVEADDACFVCNTA